jgi:hypothetical protein
MKDYMGIIWGLYVKDNNQIVRDCKGFVSHRFDFVELNLRR